MPIAVSSGLEGTWSTFKMLMVEDNGLGEIWSFGNDGNPVFWEGDLGNSFSLVEHPHLAIIIETADHGDPGLFSLIIALDRKCAFLLAALKFKISSNVPSEVSITSDEIAKVIVTVVVTCFLIFQTLDPFALLMSDLDSECQGQNSDGDQDSLHCEIIMGCGYFQYLNQIWTPNPQQIKQSQKLNSISKFEMFSMRKGLKSLWISSSITD